jgi:Trypsin-like peptidase domain
MNKHTGHYASMMLITCWLVLCQLEICPSVIQMNCDESKRGVVRIESANDQTGESQTGAGIVVGLRENTVFVLTALHIVEKANRINVTFFQNRNLSFSGTLFNRINRELDLAVVTVNSNPSQWSLNSFPSFTLGTLLNQDIKLSTLGHPDGLNWQCYHNEYTVSRDNYEDDFRKFLFTNPALQLGNSGGAVFNEKGALVGMISGRGPAGNAIAIKIDALLNLLKEWGVPSSSLSNTQPPKRTIRLQLSKITVVDNGIGVKNPWTFDVYKDESLIFSEPKRIYDNNDKKGETPFTASAQSNKVIVLQGLEFKLRVYGANSKNGQEKVEGSQTISIPEGHIDLPISVSVVAESRTTRGKFYLEFTITEIN